MARRAAPSGSAARGWRVCALQCGRDQRRRGLWGARLVVLQATTHGQCGDGVSSGRVRAVRVADVRQGYQFRAVRSDVLGNRTHEPVPGARVQPQSGRRVHRVAHCRGLLYNVGGRIGHDRGLTLPEQACGVGHAPVAFSIGGSGRVSLPASGDLRGESLA